MFTDITTIKKGVIMHQVNCQNVVGKGVTKDLFTKYPQVQEQFHQITKDYNAPQKRFGLTQHVKINDQLVIINSFSQLHNGRKRKQDVSYVDTNALEANLLKLDAYAKEQNLPAYVPSHIGRDWPRVEQFIKENTDIIIVY